MTGLVDRFEKSGFVVREASSTDRRILHIRITQEGIDKIEPRALSNNYLTSIFFNLYIFCQQIFC
jgi:DNA-binding MarR family transcriptional regulator